MLVKENWVVLSKTILSNFLRKTVFSQNHLSQAMVKGDDSWLRDCGFNPPLWRPFFRGTIDLDQCLEQKLWRTLNWHCCMCCNPANGMVDFEEWSAYKIQLHGIEWIVSLTADWDQSPKKEKRTTYPRQWLR